MLKISRREMFSKLSIAGFLRGFPHRHLCSPAKRAPFPHNHAQKRGTLIVKEIDAILCDGKAVDSSPYQDQVEKSHLHDYTIRISSQQSSSSVPSLTFSILDRGCKTYLFNFPENITRRSISEKRIHDGPVETEMVFFTQNSWDNFAGLPVFFIGNQDGGKGEHDVSLEKLPSALVCPKDSPQIPSRLQWLCKDRLKLTPSDGKSISSFSDDFVNIVTVPLFKSSLADQTEAAIQANCYLVEIPTVRGSKNKSKIDQFLIKHPYMKRSMSLLWGGLSLRLTDGTTVDPDEFCGPPRLGMTSMIVDCPLVGMIPSLSRPESPFNRYFSENLENYRSNYSFAGKDIGFKDILFHSAPELKYIFHMTPYSVFSSSAYVEWMNRFPSTVEHILLNNAPDLVDTPLQDVSSTFYSMVAAHHSDLFPTSLFLGTSPKISVDQIRSSLNISGQLSRCSDGQCFTLRDVKRSMNHIERLGYDPKRHFLDLSHSVDKALSQSPKGRWMMYFVQDLLNEDLNVFLSHSRRKFDSLLSTKAHSLSTHPYSSVCILGTSATAPSPLRNCSGYLVRYDQNKYLLMDCGEGTLGQIHTRCGDSFNKVLASISCIFVSHSHADHIMGLAYLLSRRAAVVSELKRNMQLPPDAVETPVIVAPRVVYNLLEEICGKGKASIPYRPLDCRVFQSSKTNSNVGVHPELTKLGVERYIRVPVVHNYEAAASVVEFSSGFKFAFSGDCRPSKDFANHGQNADILIHEATFLPHEHRFAQAIKHSTSAEAVDIAFQMKAKIAILSHFRNTQGLIPFEHSKLEVLMGSWTADKSLATIPELLLGFDFMTIYPGQKNLSKSYERCEKFALKASFLLSSNAFAFSKRHTT